MRVDIADVSTPLSLKTVLYCSRIFDEEMLSPGHDREFSVFRWLQGRGVLSDEEEISEEYQKLSFSLSTTVTQFVENWVTTVERLILYFMNLDSTSWINCIIPYIYSRSTSWINCIIPYIYSRITCEGALTITTHLKLY